MILQKPKHFKNNNGFSLIELMAVIAIFGILGTIVFTLARSGNSNYTYQKSLNDAQTEARVAMSAITSRIRLNDARDETAVSSFVDAGLMSYLPNSAVLAVHETAHEATGQIKPTEIGDSSRLLRILRNGSPAEYIYLTLDGGILKECSVPVSEIKTVTALDIPNNAISLTTRTDIIEDIIFKNISDPNIKNQYLLEVEVRYYINGVLDAIKTQIQLRSEVQ